MKHLKKSAKKSYISLVAKILFILEAIVLPAGLIYMAITQLFPIKYILLFLFLSICLIVFHISMFLMKTKGAATKVISLVLSILVLLVSSVGTVALGTIHSSFSKIPSEEVETEAVKINVAKKPFLIYLSGVDTRGGGEIKDKALSDVNMVIAVNPKSGKLLMVNIPRDFYVPLEGDPAKMDKLTHAGTKGVSCSMKTLEALFDIKFNYYVKVNFESVVEVVDTLGGVTVNSEYNFTSYYSLDYNTTYTFVKGENDLTGRSALAFARERKNVPGGDRTRGKHQQAIIKAIINKAISPSNLMPSKISKLVDCVTKHTSTNIAYSEISDLVKLQLDKMPSWDIQTISVDGKGSTQPTYVTGGLKASVIIPNMETVEAAKIQIKSCLEG
ncbi:MAG: LCP family protein [Clostridia bacterium]|nr:LCP family protein [Clostridia bacterium]